MLQSVVLLFKDQGFKGVACHPSRLDFRVRRVRAAAAAAAANGDFRPAAMPSSPTSCLQHAIGEARISNRCLLDDMHRLPVVERLGPMMSGLRCLSCHGHAEKALAFPAGRTRLGSLCFLSLMLQSLLSETKDGCLAERPIAIMSGRQGQSSSM